MRKILLAAVNARYSHTNPAVRSIERYCRKRVADVDITITEWTISQPLLEIIRGVFDTSPEMVLFSVYIWNNPLILQAASELRKIFPDLLIGMGGPEVSYQAEKLMRQHKAVDFIIKGEGEKTCAEITELFTKSEKRSDYLRKLPQIAGIFYRDGKKIHEPDGSENILFSQERDLITDMNTLPFIYTDDGTANGTLSDGFSPRNQLAYYESSRGCPFRCSYCLSSLDKTVRYLPLERVLDELDFFLRHNFRTIKFTDRTFNLDPERYLSIWRYIASHHNGVTAFHFEIDALHLCHEAFEILSALPAGVVQFEIGLQSTNAQTLAEIRRTTDLQKLAHNIQLIPENVHVHLDLIAGLPHEDFNSFKNSFDFAAALKPHMLQLGFLKVLSGTHMEQITTNQEYKFLSIPPYEILQTPVLPYRDLSRLKDIEFLLDIFYNSRNFVHTLSFVSGSLFDFFNNLAVFLLRADKLYHQRTVQDNFAVLFDFTKTFEPQKSAVFEELLRLDFILLGKTGTFPQWYKRRYNRETHEKALYTEADFFNNHPESQNKTPVYPASARERFARSDYEQFSIHPFKDGFPAEQTRFLFLYPKRGEQSVLNYSSAQKTQIREYQHL